LRSRDQKTTSSGCAIWNQRTAHFFEDERVRVAELKHLSEFRIGGSVILLSVTPKLAVAR